MKRALLISGLIFSVLGAIAYVAILFTGPGMVSQPHIRTFERSMPLAPPGVVPVQPGRMGLPTVSQATGMRNPLQDTRANRARARIYYDYYCIFCHGKTGEGDGPVGQSYMPLPTDLRDPKINEKTDGALLLSVLTGTGHEPVLQRVMPERHWWYLVLYTRVLGEDK